MTQQIYKAMVAIMRDMDAIAKERTNSHQRYQYRGIDDLYNHCHSILAKHGVFCLPEVVKCERETVETAGGKSAVSTLVTVKFRFFAEDGSSVEVIQIGEGMDLGDKSCGKALSTAQKYAMIQTFLIPTEGQINDSEEDSLEVKRKAFPPEKNNSENTSGKGNGKTFSLEELEGFKQNILGQLKSKPGDRILQEKLRTVSQKIEELSDVDLLNAWS